MALKVTFVKSQIDILLVLKAKVVLILIVSSGESKRC